MRLLLPFVALSACAAEPDAARLAAPAAPPPGDFTLTTGPLVAGASATLAADGVTPGSRVYFVVSAAGLGAGPCPPALLGRCAGVRNPITVLGSSVANVAGEASLLLRLPAGLPAGGVAFQAAVLGASAQLSNPAPAWVHVAGTPFAVGVDLDGDGYTWSTGDCFEGSGSVRPGAVDPPGDGDDQDCDGVDGTDNDGDGVLAAGAGGADCDDGDASVFPGQVETCDAVDEDCDGLVDDGLITDGTGCQDPGPSPAPATVGVLHAVTRTATTANADSDTVNLELCLSATDCFPLGNPNWDDWEPGAVDVKVHEGLAVPRARIDRVQVRLTGGGTDAWKPDCLQVVLDGEPVYCSAGPGQFFGSSPGELTSWTDPAGLHLDCLSCDADPISHGPIIGAVGTSTARIWLRTDATRRTELRVVPAGGDLAAAAPVATRYPAASQDFTEIIEVSGLQAATRYDYELTAAGGVPQRGSFGTAPAGPAQLSFAFGSCSKDDAQPIFSAIQGMAPDFFLFVGDNHYGNTNDLSDLRQFYRWAHSRTGRDALMATTPTIAIWDDHDFVGNNTLGTAPGKANALRAFKEYWANPSYGQPTHDGIYSTWRWGEVELFLLDDRYWRGIDNDILGDIQEDWLHQRLLASTATFKLVASGSTWSPEYTSDSWGQYPNAIDELRTFIADQRVEGVVLLSGDVHRSELREIPGAPGGYTIPELVSSPLANTNSDCANANSLVACEDSGDYVIRVEIDTTLPDPTLVAHLHDASGAELHTWTILRSSLQNPSTWGPARAPDFDGDGYADLAIGAPTEEVGGASSAGAVNAVYGTSAGLNVRFDQLWDQDQAGVLGAPEAGDRVGAALATGDFDGDGFDDLAWGAPFEDLGAVVDSGYVQVLYGGPGRLSSAGMLEIMQGAAAFGGTIDAGDQLGAALASGDFNGDGVDDLAIGAPGEDGWGEVTVAYGSAGGLTNAGVDVWNQGNTGPNSANEAGDRYGAALAAGDFDGDGFDDLAIGHPGEALGAVSEAGMLTVVFGSSTGLTNTRDQELHQDTAGVPGDAELGDHMGAALAAGDLNGDGFDDLVAAAPDDEIGGVAGAGYVIVVSGSAAGLAPATADGWTLNQPALGLTAASGDQLGAAVALCDVDADGFDDLVLGAPGRAVGGASRAGAVITLRAPAGVPDAAAGVVLLQDPHPDLASEANDAHGANLGCADFNADGFEDLSVGAPGEAVGAIAGAGMVVVYPGGPAGPAALHLQVWHQDKTDFEGVAEAGDGLGVLAAAQR